MDENETRSIELDSGDARTVVSALSHAKGTMSERKQEELTNIQRQVQTAFGFGERGDDESGFSGTVLGESREETDSHLNTPTGGAESRSVELSRGEAESVVAALSEYEGDGSDAAAIADVREQFESMFGFGGNEDESDDGLL